MTDTIETHEVVTGQELALRTEPAAVGILRPADTLDRIAEAFREYQRVCETILDKSDYQEYEGRPRKKKSAWRKLATAFNVSTRVVEKEIEKDTNRNVLSAFFTIEAQAGNRVTNGSGYCEITEKCCATRMGHKCRKAGWKGHFCCENGCDGRKHWSHANHDIISTAETRAKNRAIADLIGCGEVSAEELADENHPHPTPPPAPPQPKPDPAKPAPFPTEASRKKMLDELKANPGQPNRDIVDEYFRKLENPSALLPNEQLEDLSLRFVPATKGQMNALANKLAEFGNGERATWPYPPHDEPDKAKKAEEEDELPGLPSKSVVSDAWRNVIIPIAPKGMKRDAYLKNPQTIGQLFDMRHGQDEESQAGRQRLWGFVNHFQAKPWVGKDGQERPPSKTDVQFREALDLFQVWFSANHPGEKL